MALKKSEKRLLGMLGLVLGFFLLDRFVLKSKPDKPASTPPAAQTAAVLKASVQTATAMDTSSAKIQYRDWGRDPFASLGAEPVVSSKDAGRKGSRPAEPKAVLSGIFRKQGKAFALINDQVYAEGEEKDGIRTIRIDEDRVLCTAQGRPVTLYWRDML